MMTMMVDYDDDICLEDRCICYDNIDKYDDLQI
jgi:hypothetical protein